MQSSLILGPYFSPPAFAQAPRPTFAASYAHTTIHYPTPGTSLDWVVDSGTSHHVTSDLVALTLHEPYTASDSVNIGDGSGLSIANIDLFSLTSSLDLYFFSNVLHVLAMSKNLISVLAFCTDNPINVLFFESFFQVQDRQMGVHLVHGLLLAEINPLSIFCPNYVFLSLVLAFRYLYVVQSSWSFFFAHFSQIS